MFIELPKHKLSVCNVQIWILITKCPLMAVQRTFMVIIKIRGTVKLSSLVIWVSPESHCSSYRMWLYIQQKGAKTVRTDEGITTQEVENTLHEKMNVLWWIFGAWQTIWAFPIESSQHNQVSRVCHRALVQIVLLHLQPVALPWFIAALSHAQTQSQRHNVSIVTYMHDR